MLSPYVIQTYEIADKFSCSLLVLKTEYIVEESLKKFEDSKNINSAPHVGATNLSTTCMICQRPYN